MMNSQHNASYGSGMVMHNNNNHHHRSRSRSKSRSKSMNRRQSSGGQSSLSAHIQLQMERPRRERDPTPLQRSASAHNYNASAPNLNYNHGGHHHQQQPQQQHPQTPSRRSSAGGMLRRTNTTNMIMRGGNSNHPSSSSEERAAIAANMAKNSFSAHRNLQKLIDEQRQLDKNRMEHAQHQQQQQQQQLQVYHPQQQQYPQEHHHHHHQEYNNQEYRSPSSVAAVHQEEHQTPLKMMVVNTRFSRRSSLSVSTMTPQTLSPDVPQIQRVPSSGSGTPGRNSGYNQNHPHQMQQQQNQRRHSASPRKQGRDHHEAFPPLPDFDEDQLTSERPDLELAQSITKIMAFHKRSSTPGRQRSSQCREIVGYDPNKAAQQQQQQRSNSQQLMLYRNDSSNVNKGKSRSFHSNSTAPTTTSSLDSGSLFATTSSESEPSNHTNSSSFQTAPSTAHEPQLQQQQRVRYIDKETLYTHLQHAPRESRVQLTRHVETLQSENQRLNEVTSSQAHQIDKLESEIGDLLKELLKYRREYGEMQSVVVSEGDVSSEHATTAPPPPSSAGGGMSSPFSLMHSSSSSKIEMNRQDPVSNTDKDEELEVVRPYVKSKSLHEETLDRDRRPAAANKRRFSNSITSAPVVTRSSSGSSNDNSFARINTLKNLQLRSSFTSSCHSDGDDNDNQTRNSNSDSQTTGLSFVTAEESIFESTLTAKQRSFKEEKKTDSQATSRWRRVSAINNEDDDPPSDCEGSIDEAQLLLIQQQQEHEENQQDEVSRETRLKSNSLEDLFEPQKRKSCFVEQKCGSASNSSVPSMTDTVGSCSWSYSTPESGGRC